MFIYLEVLHIVSIYNYDDANDLIYIDKLKTYIQCSMNEKSNRDEMGGMVLIAGEVCCSENNLWK